MTGPGAITVAASASVTAPTSLPLALGSAAAAQYRTSGAFDTVYLPSIKAMLHLNGVGLNFHSLEGTNYPTGILGVALAHTATPTAARATATWTFVGSNQPQDGDEMVLANNTTGYVLYFRTKSTLTTTYTAFTRTVEIKIGANLAATIANIQGFVNGTGTEGTTFHWRDSAFTMSSVLTNMQITVSATAATTVTFRSTVYGTAPNSWTGASVVNTGGTPWTISNFSGGNSGTGSTPVEGTYTYRYSRVRTADGAISYASPLVSVTQTAPGSINLASFVAAPTRDAVDYYRWNRTTDGGSLYYRGADVATGTGEPFSDAVTDATLTGAFAIKYDDRIYRPYTAGYPAKCKYGCLYKGRVFAGGADLASYKARGTASVTAASYSVTLSSAAYPTVDWIGRQFQVTGEAQTYLIVDVTESTRVLTLNLPYNGSTVGSASYSVTDVRNPLLVYYSEPLLPNNWPAANSVLGITSQDPSGISGMREFDGALVVWTQTEVHRIIGDTGSGFAARPSGAGTGAFNNRCVVATDDSLFWLGAGGLWMRQKGSEPESLSDPKNTGKIPAGIARTLARLNINQRDAFFANYNPTENVLRWWVALDGETLCNYVIVYDLQTGQFTLDTCQAMTAAATIPDNNGAYRTIAGDAFGNVWQLDLSVSDGVYGIDRVQAVSSYATTTNKITLSGTPLSTTDSGYAGCPVLVIAAADGSVQRSKIASNTSGVITLTGPITAPTAGDQVLLGAIHYRLRTSRWDLEEGFVQRGLPAVTALFVPSTGQLWCAAAKDNDEPTVYAPGTVRGFSGADVADTSTSTLGNSGYKLFWHRKGKCRRLCVEFFGFTLGADWGLIGWIPSVASTDTAGG